MNSQKLWITILLVMLAADALAELYFASRRNNLTGEVSGYLRSVHGRFESYYAERNRKRDRTSEPPEGGIRGDASVDNGNGERGENAD